MSSDDQPDLPRSRHRGGGDDPQRRRYFTELDSSERSNTRHRRRRLEGDTTLQIWQTGQVPRVSDTVDPGTGRVLPQRIAPGQRVDQAPAVRPSRQAAAPAAEPRVPEPPVDVPASGELTVTDDDGPNIRRHQPEPERTDDAPDVEPTVPLASLAAANASLAATSSRVDDQELPTDVSDDYEPPFTRARAYSDVVDEPSYPITDADVAEPDSPPPGTDGRRRKTILAVVVAVLVVMIVGLGYFGLRFLGVIGTSDYTNAQGTGDVLVTIPDDATLRDFGEILTQNNVVGSVKAFTNAADGKTMSAGIYRMRTEIPAATAVEMLDDPDMTYRVGRLVIPEGIQLDSKTGIDGKTTPGVFELISQATSTTVNGKQVGVSVQALTAAAADADIAQLGIPQWAKTEVTALAGDHRRIEGLVAPGTWEAIEPTASATEILHTLITDSARRYEQWGLLSANSSTLSPYETLVAASVVEREVSAAADYPKVARVILNRLAVNQRLEMDSTANYTAAITNIDVHGDAYKADNKWNTYRVTGLPPTPIATVGQKALDAVLHPADGGWKYFITVDKQGTTLFANTFEEHKKNRETACANRFLTVGCG